MDCPRRHRVGGYVGQRLHRRLFAWFGASIIVTGLLVFIASVVITDRSPTDWHEDIDRFKRFTAARFVAVWDRPQERDQLAGAVSQELDLQVVLRDGTGARLAAFGPSCDIRPMSVAVPAVSPGGAPVGTLELCANRYRAAGGTRLAILLVVAGLVLWGASGRIARRLTAPLGDLVRVTQEIGAGRLSARAPVSCATSDEVGVLADAINDMAWRIERQLNDQRVLLASVSHELRTPLGHLRLLVELGRQKGGDGAALDEIERELVEIDHLVGELLASSRLDFTALSPQELDAKDVAQRALERSGVDPAKLQVEGTIPRFRGDPTLVARALANLIDNANKHGGGVAKLVVREREGRVIFAVEDLGTGIRPGEEAKIFEPFYRREVGSGSKSTLGLGLSLVRRIAEAHGGRAYAENRDEGGARVTFELAA